MADVLTDLKNWSTTASSNLPSGTTAIGTGLDDNLRQLQATVRQDLSSVGADIASAGTCDLGAIPGLFHTITGTTTITSFGTVSAGIWKILRFSGAVIITHNATSLICPYSANFTTAAGDGLLCESLGSGNWKVYPLHVAALHATLAGSASQAFATASLTASGSVQINSPTGYFEYVAGAGGTVTQLTNKTTGVTLNKPCGLITMNNAALAGGATVTFILTNSLIGASTILSYSISGSSVAGATYRIETGYVSTGSAAINVTNTSGGSLSEAVAINFKLSRIATS